MWRQKDPVSALLALSFLVTFFSSWLAIALAKDLTLTILHTNDVHSRFLQTSKFSGSCSDEDAASKKCYGGFARLHYKVRELRSQIPNVVYLSGGDYYQGTIWYTIYKWKIISKYVNILNHTAMAFGNHEFDDNIDGIVPFLEAATFPVIACNIDDSKEPRFQGKYKKSVVVPYEGVDVGIIGFTTTETMAISAPGELIFNDEVESITKEAQRLHDSGVKILIAVGHAGYDVDLKIAEKVPLIDVVVGGHTNTFLYHGAQPDIEEPLGDYPTIVTQSSGRKVLVVQAYAFGKYLGYLNVTFNEAGEATSWAGNPILMDHTIPQDQTILEELADLGKNLTEEMKKEVGKTHVFLNGTSRECRLHECNMGNVVTDAMIYANLKTPDELYWSDVTMAVMNGGGIRVSIDEKSRNGSISVEDVLTVLPFRNTIDLIEIKGQHLKEAFEFAVEGYDPAGFHLAGKFLQISGIRVVYDISQPEGSRVRSLQVLCKKCRVPYYVPIEMDEVYKLAIPTYIVKGGDGFQVLKNNIIKHHENGILDSEMLIKYIEARSPIIQGVEGRIQFYEGLPACCASESQTFSVYLETIFLHLYCVT
ncbi:unnamed protein product, partial [Allacma fusca]